MPSKNVRNIGNPKKRKHGKYAIDVHREKDYHSMAAIFLLFYFRSTDDFRKRQYLLMLLLLAIEIEDIQRDIRCITEPVERKYLR